MSSTHSLSRAQRHASRVSGHAAHHSLLTSSFLPSALFRSLGGSSQPLAPITGCGADGTIADASGFEDETATSRSTRPAAWIGTASPAPGAGRPRPRRRDGHRVRNGSVSPVRPTWSTRRATTLRGRRQAGHRLSGPSDGRGDTRPTWPRSMSRASGSATRSISSSVGAAPQQHDQSDVFISFEFNQARSPAGPAAPSCSAPWATCCSTTTSRAGVNDQADDLDSSEQRDGRLGAATDIAAAGRSRGPSTRAVASSTTSAVRAATPSKYEFGEAGIDIGGARPGGNGRQEVRDLRQRQRRTRTSGESTAH